MNLIDWAIRTASPSIRQEQTQDGATICGQHRMSGQADLMISKRLLTRLGREGSPNPLTESVRRRLYSTYPGMEEGEKPSAVAANSKRIAERADTDSMVDVRCDSKPKGTVEGQPRSGEGLFCVAV